MTDSSCDLKTQSCKPCSGEGDALAGDALQHYVRQLDDSWTLIDEQRIRKEFSFKNFREALDFTNAVGELAESEGHHPVIELTWGRVTVTLWTHKVGGLTANDFILAAKIDAV